MTGNASQYRGAPMGKPTGTIDTTAGRLSLRRVAINSGGYDASGAYWGLGLPLWHVMDASGNSQYFRCKSLTSQDHREAAKTTARLNWPGATFYR